MAKTRDTAAFIEILKYDEQADGTLMVYGKATDDTLDSDQQICDPAWLDRAMPDWFKFGNVREQHSNIAAGVATEYERKNDGHYIGVHVVDPSSANKVKTRVLKGFSVGIRSPRVVKDNKAAGGRIVDGTIVEVSLVDRPANPSCVLTMAKSEGGSLVQVEELNITDDTIVEDSVIKREFTAEEREQAAQAGHALPDGSFPIKSKEDLRNAISSYGRAKDPAKAKAHIIARARDLDAVDELPESWNVKDASVIIELSKQFAGELNKFDQAAFDTARQALATLIQVEAGELAAGEDETHSLAWLLAAVSALFEWHEGEAAGGETTPIPETEEDEDETADIHLADGPDTVKDPEPEPMKEAMCKECHKAESECVCPTCPTCGEKTAACKCAEGGYTQTEIKSLTADDVRSIVTETIKSLLPTNSGEDTVTKTTESERIKALEEELVKVKALAAPSGPRRMGVAGANAVNEVLVKAAAYRAKAANTDDTALREGYLALAKDLENTNPSK